MAKKLTPAQLALLRQAVAFDYSTYKAFFVVNHKRNVNSASVEGRDLVAYNLVHRGYLETITEWSYRITDAGRDALAAIDANGKQATGDKSDISKSVGAQASATGKSCLPVHAPDYQPVGRYTDMFRAGSKLVFEDGMSSVFSDDIQKELHANPVTLLSAIRQFVQQNLYLKCVSETLRWVGRVDDSETLDMRRSFLVDMLTAEDNDVKDAAILGLASMDDPSVIPDVVFAMDHETSKQLREDMKQLLEQLRETATQVKPTDYRTARGILATDEPAEVMVERLRATGSAVIKDALGDGVDEAVANDRLLTREQWIAMLNEPAVIELTTEQKLTALREHVARLEAENARLEVALKESEREQAKFIYMIAENAYQAWSAQVNPPKRAPKPVAGDMVLCQTIYTIGGVPYIGRLEGTYQDEVYGEGYLIETLGGDKVRWSNEMLIKVYESPRYSKNGDSK